MKAQLLCQQAHSLTTVLPTESSRQASTEEFLFLQKKSDHGNVCLDGVA